jgi:hypothetical protein
MASIRHRRRRRRRPSPLPPSTRSSSTTVGGGGVLNPTIFDDCVRDMAYAEANMDRGLDRDEYLSFLVINAARYGYIVDVAIGNVHDDDDAPSSSTLSSTITSLDRLPLEFPMLFHSTACLCAYDRVIAGEGTMEKGVGTTTTTTTTTTWGRMGPLDVDFGCCMGDLGRVNVYDIGDGGGGGDEYGLFKNDHDDANDGDRAYASVFCVEAMGQYSEFLVASTTTLTPSADVATVPPTVAPATYGHKWNKSFDELVKYHSIHNNCAVPRNVLHLGEWVNNQRRSKKIYDAGKKCSLTVERIDKLNTLGFEWSLSP